MKQLYSIFLIAVLISLTAFQVVETCDSTFLKKELKEKLKPDFKYDSSKSTKFYYKNKPQRKEIEIPLYRGEKYRFLFHTGGLSRRDVKIEIYDKPVDNKKRTLLYELMPNEGQSIYVFEPEKSRKMYLDYSIPEVAEPTEQQECIAFVLGYKLKITL